MIALRFLLGALLAIGGQVRVDPDAAHDEDEVGPTPDEDGRAEDTSGDAT